MQQKWQIAFLLDRSRNVMPWDIISALYHCEGTGGVMRVCPTRLHMFCGSGGGLWPCPSSCPVGTQDTCALGVLSKWPFVTGHSISVLSESEMVCIAGSKSDPFPVSVGLPQGCPLSQVLFIIFMDRISRHSHVVEGIRFGDLRIPSLLFADDVVLLASSSSDLQFSLGRFLGRVRSGRDENLHL